LNSSRNRSCTSRRCSRPPPYTWLLTTFGAAAAAVWKRGPAGLEPRRGGALGRAAGEERAEHEEERRRGERAANVGWQHRGRDTMSGRRAPGGARRQPSVYTPCNLAPPVADWRLGVSRSRPGRVRHLVTRQRLARTREGAPLDGAVPLRMLTSQGSGIRRRGDAGR
jgi:hypothetical protein